MCLTLMEISRFFFLQFARFLINNRERLSVVGIIINIRSLNTGRYFANQDFYFCIY